MCSFSPKSKGLRTRRANGVRSSLKASSRKTQEKPVFQFESKTRNLYPTQGRQAGGVPSYSWVSQLFPLFRPSTDWMRTTHIREDNLLCTVYPFKC